MAPPIPSTVQSSRATHPGRWILFPFVTRQPLECYRWAPALDPTAIIPTLILFRHRLYQVVMHPHLTIGYLRYNSPCTVNNSPIRWSPLACYCLFRFALYLIRQATLLFIFINLMYTRNCFSLLFED